MDRKNESLVFVGETVMELNRNTKKPDYITRVFHVAFSASGHILSSDLPKPMNITANRLNFVFIKSALAVSGLNCIQVSKNPFHELLGLFLFVESQHR